MENYDEGLKGLKYKLKCSFYCQGESLEKTLVYKLQL